MSTKTQAVLFELDAPQKGELAAILPDGSPKFAKTLRIAVSGDVRITAAECEIIDTVAFQRLKGIRQLGAASQVYPTAIHTRFDHSLGVLSELDKLIARIRDNANQGSGPPSKHVITPRQRLIARLYALLHDITHVPFGHTLEDELKIFESHDGFQKRAAVGLDRFEVLVGPQSEIGGIIKRHYGEAMYERFRKLFLGGGRTSLVTQEDTATVHDEVLYFLVSDTVCADLLDYLRRDSFFSGLDVTISDRVLNYMYVDEVKGSGDAPDMVMPVLRLWKNDEKEARSDLLTDLVDLLEARFKIGERIYFHPAKMIADAMVGRAVFEAVQADLLSSTAMLEHSDDSLLRWLGGLERSAPIAARLANSYRGRKLYKRIAKFGVRDFPEGGDKADLSESALEELNDPAKRTAIENELAVWAGVEPGMILIFPPSKRMNSKVARVMVDWKGGRVPLSKITNENIKNRLALVNASHENLWGVHLLCHPDVSTEQRTRARKAFEGYFKGSQRGMDVFPELFLERMEGEDSLGNYSQPDRRKAANIAAQQFVSESLSFKGKAGGDFSKVLRGHIDAALHQIGE